MNTKSKVRETANNLQDATPFLKVLSKTYQANTIKWPSDFFQRWFRGDGGTPLFFLFKKNLKVTNIQFAELLALIRTHLCCLDGTRARSVQFLSGEEFRSQIYTLAKEFESKEMETSEIPRIVARLYGPVLEQTVAFESFFGSAAVFIPPGLHLDFSRVCGESGYIHSCGYNVFTRSIYDSDEGKFFHDVREHLKRFPRLQKKLFFTPYAHEDFTGFDKEDPTDQHDSLDDVKIFVEKSFMGEKRLVSVLRHMRAEFKDLEIPPPGDFRKTHKELMKSGDIDPGRTLWLILDHGTSETAKVPSERQYFICYDQRYRNENPFHLFDENKPAWIDQTTVPHTLMGAMISITRPFWPRGRKTILGDPFAGTGTTLLEALKLPDVEIHVSDKAQIAPLLLADNLGFFGLDYTQLKMCLDYLSKLKDQRLQSPEPFNQTGSDILRDYEWAISIYAEIQKRGEESVSPSKEIVEKIDSASRERRMLLYVALRTARRHDAAFERGSTEWGPAFMKELQLLLAQMKSLADLRQSEYEADGDGEGLIANLNSTYSKVTTITAETLRKLANAEVRNFDAIVRSAHESQQRSFDVIVTDPPYGFNTKEDLVSLAQLYALAIPRMIKSLSDDGQIVMALPDWSHTGRQLPSFALKDYITQQILVTAQMYDHEVIHSAYISPRPRGLFRLPYYWESGKALRRAILHFRFRKIEVLSTGNLAKPKSGFPETGKVPRRTVSPRRMTR